MTATPRRSAGMLTQATMRDHNLPERPSTPLELLFDLCFVVAVAVLAAEVDHGIVEGNPLVSAAIYTLLFIPIWWARMRLPLMLQWLRSAYAAPRPPRFRPHLRGRISGGGLPEQPFPRQS